MEETYRIKSGKHKLIKFGIRTFHSTKCITYHMHHLQASVNQKMAVILYSLLKYKITAFKVKLEALRELSYLSLHLLAVTCYKKFYSYKEESLTHY